LLNALEKFGKSCYVRLVQMIIKDEKKNNIYTAKDNWKSVKPRPMIGNETLMIEPVSDLNRWANSI
jgi:hypothetical protein